MTVSIWKELGIPRTRDRDAVRRAYAARLRVIHPEDDPGGFQVLRRAYEEALAYATGGGDDEAAAKAPSPRSARETAPEGPAEAVRSEAPTSAGFSALCAQLEVALTSSDGGAAAVMEAANAVLASPALEEVITEARVEAWLIRLALSHQPHSDPLLQPLIERFKWDRRLIQAGDAAPEVLLTRRRNLATWSGMKRPASPLHGAYKALSRPPGLLTPLRLLSIDLQEIRSRLAMFGHAPPADMHPRALAWWTAYFARPRPTTTALWIALVLSLAAAAALADGLWEVGLRGAGLAAALTLGIPLTASMVFGSFFGAVEAIHWPRRLLARRYWRPPALVRLGWAPAALFLMLAAALAPTSTGMAIATGAVAMTLTLWTLVTGEPDKRSGRFPWPIWGAMLQAYLVIWWLVSATLPQVNFALQLDIAFAGAVACAYLGAGSLIEWWGAEVGELQRLPALALIVAGGVGAETLVLLSRDHHQLAAIAAVALASVVFLHRLPAPFVSSGAMRWRHYVMWYGGIFANGLRAAYPEWGYAIGGAWLLVGVILTVAGVLKPDAAVWIAAWRAGRFVPCGPA